MTLEKKIFLPGDIREEFRGNLILLLVQHPEEVRLHRFSLEDSREKMEEVSKLVADNYVHRTYIGVNSQLSGRIAHDLCFWSLEKVEKEILTVGYLLDRV